VKKPGIKDRLRYAFDRAMSKGAAALIGWLFALTLAIIGIVTVVMFALGLQQEGDDWAKVLWNNLMRSMDAGTVAGDTGSWPYLLTMLFVTLAGIFVFSTLIGILSNGISAKFESLRKGRSLVVEQDHTVILGWSEQIFAVVSELCAANENKKRACVAILADKDKVEMEDELRERIVRKGRTEIVCRSGSPIDPTDIRVVNPECARSVVILAPETDDPDASVIKTLLALTNSPDRKEGAYHIVAEIHENKNFEVAEMVAKDEVEVVLTGDLTARIAAQTCRQSGLSIIYTELFDFGGDEIYFAKEPALAGSAYGDALFRYETSAIIGIERENGAILLNPPMDSIIEKGDRIIAISEDDDTIVLSKHEPRAANEAVISKRPPRPSRPESTIVIGWNWKGAKLVKELDAYSGSESRIRIVAELTSLDEAMENLRSNLSNLTLEWERGDSTDRALLDGLGVEKYDHVIVLSYSDELDDQAADAKTIVTLLHLRRISQSAGKDLSIVSEMLDSRNRELAEIAQADDFVIGGKLVALVLAQISENKDLAPVFAELLDPEGAELYLKPADEYVNPGAACDFYTVLEAARRKGETAIGYRVAAHSHESAAAYGVVLNPKKSAILRLQAEDRVVVLSDS